MKRLLFLICACLALTVALIATAHAQDIRAAARKAVAERDRTAAAARLAEERILADRTALTAAVDSIEALQATLSRELESLAAQQHELRTDIARLAGAWSAQELDFRETTGNVRLSARDAESMLDASPLSAGHPDRVAAVSRLLAEGYFPDLDDISGLAAVLLDEMVRSGQITAADDVFVGRDGTETVGRIYQLGKFTTIYELPDEQGFLTHLPESHTLHALPSLPDRGTRRVLSRWLGGASAVAPVDLSGGAALRGLTARNGLTDSLREGGPLVWPILLVALAALVIVTTKFVALRRVHTNADRLMGEVGEHANAGDWEACGRVLDRADGKSPVVRIIRAGLAARGRRREALESVLQEAILHELPTLQRGLAILAVMGGVAPLLGLLGTVTGMIETFRVITVYGTGDPKLMSGGISEALITTELGLAVAIPIMLLHVVLSRRVDHAIGDMEKQAVNLVNIIAREED